MEFATSFFANLFILIGGAGCLFFLSVELQVNADDKRDHAMIGLVLGCLAALVIFLAVHMPQGTVMDTRAAPVFHAAFFAGPVGGLIAAALGAMARYAVGGPFAWGGITALFLYAAAGLLARRALLPRGRTPLNLKTFVLCGLGASALAIPAFAVDQGPAVAVAILKAQGWLFLFNNLFGIVVLGYFIQRMQIVYAELALQRDGNAAKARFLQNMSHELRTPLNAIVGYADLIKTLGPEKVGADKVEEYVRYIHSSGLHLVDLITDILDFAKIDAGELTLQNDRVDIGELVAWSMSTVRPLAETKSIRLVAVNGADAPAKESMTVDQRCARQCLLNILSNAVKYAPNGSTVRIAAGADWDGLRITVQDEGPGMSLAQIGMIGRPFMRGATAVQQGIEGTGLGLAITERLMESIGGALTVRPGPSTGLFVSLIFPRTQRAAPTQTDGDALT